MKQLNLIRNLFSVAVMITLACNVSAQVSIRDRIQIMDRDVFNYPELTEAPVKTKKSKTNRIVYSDRTGNQSYEDPYFQRKRSSHGIGTPYYIVGEKNGTYKLVQADPDITGKPKSIIGFLYNSKRHFKEPRKVNYAGWIPSENVLMYDHARINPRNNQPIRYRIGINSINKLFDIHQFFNGDTLKIYGEPFLKTTTDAVVVSGEVVYLYKLDKSGKSALISNVPALSDSTKRFLGWVPADLLAEVGQNEVYHIDYSRYRDSLLCAVNLMYPDTLALHNANIQGTMLFNLDGNPAGPMTNGNIRLNYPLSVWDKNWNKIINIKGGDIMVSDVRKMEAENKNVNIARLKAAKAQEEQAKLSFQQALLNAGSEVSNALSLYQKTSEKVESRQMQVESAKKASEDTKELFNLGTSTYLEVLSAQQSYLSAQISQVSDCFDRMQAVVSLYQALGGGREE